MVASPASPQAHPLWGFLFDALVALALALAIATAVMVLGAVATQGGLPPQGRFGTAWYLVVTGAGMGGSALVLYAWRRRATPGERRASLAASRRPATWRRTLLVATAMFAATRLLQLVLDAFDWRLDPTNLDILRRGLITEPAFVLVFAAVIAPAYEELLFRRVLLGRFLAAGKPIAGLMLSSAVFALVHEVPGTGTNPLAATVALWLLYGGMGAALGWLYWRTGTLLAPIAAHGLHNLASALLVLGTLS